MPPKIIHSFATSTDFARRLLCLTVICKSGGNAVIVVRVVVAVIATVVDNAEIVGVARIRRPQRRNWQRITYFKK